MEKNKKKKKTIEQELKRDKIMLVITSLVIVILLSLLVASRNYRDFSAINIKTNNKTIFSISDLTINNLKYGDNEEKVLKELGTPIKESNETKDKYSYKELEYNNLKITLRENYDDYILTGVEIKSDKYVINRNIKIGNSIVKTMKKFKVENKSGQYLYGNYSIGSLSDEEITDTIYFGVRNNKKVVYVNKDATVNDMYSNISKLTLDYKKGKITKITWSYDFE
jgi:hypothetical protein